MSSLWYVYVQAFLFMSLVVNNDDVGLIQDMDVSGTPRYVSLRVLERIEASMDPRIVRELNNMNQVERYARMLLINHGFQHITKVQLDKVVNAIYAYQGMLNDADNA